MRKKAAAALVALAFSAVPAAAAGWSLGIGTGPFVFGKFAERTQGIKNEDDTAVARSTLSAATRPGATASLEVDLSRRFALRAEASATRAPLRFKSPSGGGVTVDAGDVGVTTIALPLVLHINRGGALQFSLLGGPAAAMYRIHRSAGAPTTLPLFASTRTRLGGMAAASLAWWLSDRFAIEGEISDTVTGSPFRRENITASTTGGVTIPKTENVHTTVGVRWRLR